MTGIDYLLVGHIASDIVPEGRALGGTVAYAVFVARAFGLRPALLTSAAPDEPLLRQLPPDVPVHVVPATHTTTYENIYTAAERVQYLRAVAHPLTPGDVPVAWRAAPLLHIAPIADEIDATRHADYAPQAAITLTPQGFMRQQEADQRVTPRRWFDADALRGAQLTILSEDDIAAEPTIEADYAREAPLLVVTDGAKGGRYYLAGERHDYTAHPVTADDPTGAGDVFAVSCTAAYHLTGDIHRAIDVAARVAAWSTMRSGLPDCIPSPERIAALL
ncbi:MAG: hypothetical protein EA396_04640 [Anaerolineaceae bacterium]|nr:MAG: hypothetical protein EA396_04640 [Anaerolineaceae bacterium]